ANGTVDDVPRGTTQSRGDRSISTTILASPSRPAGAQRSATVESPNRSASFVTHVGSHLMLNGLPFRFSGINIYNANSDGKTCWYELGSDGLAGGLSKIGSQGVFRTWFFQYMATKDGFRDWTVFDRTVSIAAAKGWRIIATLGNQWKDCEGPGAQYKDESWYQVGYRSRPAALPASYRDWIVEVVKRYRDSPTILAWQMMNEAEARFS